MASDFSTLPLDVLGVIALKLETFEDFIKFSAVCRSWDLASSSIKHQWAPTPVVPWLLLAENTQNNPNCVRKIFNLSNNKCYNLNLPQTFGARCWGSPYGWIAMIDRNYDVILFNPITKAQIPFPCLKSLDDGGVKSKSDKGYHNWFLGCFANRLIVLKVPQNDHYEFVVLVVHVYYHSLSFARQGDKSWIPVLVNSKEHHIVDIVGMDDNIFGLYGDGSIVFWNFKEFNTLELIKPADYSPCRHEFIVKFYQGGCNHIYFVRSGSDLLIVLRYKDNYVTNNEDEDEDDIACKTVDFDVYRLNSIHKSWEEIKDLGEVALIVGGNTSMCVSVAHSKGLQRNCIYFTDDECCFWNSSIDPGGHDMGFFDMKNGNIQRFYHGDDMHSSFAPPTLFIPQL
ncbi:F-box/kelch-repeat protein KIB1-like [Silene latifolia]|uniref:F-box/kelch-repeat protein KIB1-like n=1 Tax=Silene latifolia TaxID=37657 RepID=UPI003D77AC1C